MSNFHTIMVIVLAILMVILLSYQTSDLQRSPNYYYRYIALLSFEGACFMAFSFVFLRYFSMLHWIQSFLAQHTLQDLHQILIQAMPGHSKTCVCCAANCIVFSYCKLHSLIILKPFFKSITLLHYPLHFLSSQTISFSCRKFDIFAKGRDSQRFLSTTFVVIFNCLS